MLRIRCITGRDVALQDLPLAGVYVDRRREESRQERFERTKREIAERVERLCSEMPHEEFDDLVTHMAELQIKYTLRRSEDLFPEIVEWERGAVDLADVRSNFDDARTQR